MYGLECLIYLSVVSTPKNIDAICADSDIDNIDSENIVFGLCRTTISALTWTPTLRNMFHALFVKIALLMLSTREKLNLCVKFLKNYFHTILIFRFRGVNVVVLRVDWFNYT